MQKYRSLRKVKSGVYPSFQVLKISPLGIYLFICLFIYIYIYINKRNNINRIDQILQKSLGESLGILNFGVLVIIYTMLHISW